MYMTVIAVCAGILAQIAAAYARIPSIVPLLTFGIIIGPQVLGFLDPKEFGNGLESIVRLCVAIILFEAGLNLDRVEIKKHHKVIIPLISYGGLVTMTLGAVFSKLVIGFSWQEAFLFGSLIIVTGPTVINPLLRRVRVRARLKNILELEGVFIDPVGAMIAIFVVELILQESPSFLHGLSLVFVRLGVGILIGSVGGFLIGGVIKRWTLLWEEVGELFVLASALGIYALSEAILVETGLMAAVAFGVILANMEIPGKQTLKSFKGKISILVISLLFILLAANLDLKHITLLGWKGVAVVLAILFIARPIEIFIATRGTDLRLSEKVFLSYICPRGIVAASMSSIFVIELSARGIGWGSEIQGLVFLTIGISVLLQGLTADSVAKVLGVLVESRKAVIVGANDFGRLVGRLLKNNGKEVSFIDSNDLLIRMAYLEGFQALAGNCLDPDNLTKIGIGEADTLLALTTNNNVNLLVSRLAKEDFGVKTVLPALNQFERDEEKGIAKKLGLEIAFGKPIDLYETNFAIARKDYRVFECTVDDSIVGKRIEELPGGVDIIPVIVIRGKPRIPVPCQNNLTIEKGDKIVLVDLSMGTAWLGGAGFKEWAQLTL
jgi:NhaP-type Na+/H+ or K+/H+ antiporter/Trk K+ transport system NAD-binding subunit